MLWRALARLCCKRYQRKPKWKQLTLTPQVRVIGSGRQGRGASSPPSPSRSLSDDISTCCSEDISPSSSDSGVRLRSTKILAT